MLLVLTEGYSEKTSTFLSIQLYINVKSPFTYKKVQVAFISASNDSAIVTPKNLRISRG